MNTNNLNFLLRYLGTRILYHRKDQSLLIIYFWTILITSYKLSSALKTVGIIKDYRLYGSKVYYFTDYTHF